MFTAFHVFFERQEVMKAEKAVGLPNPSLRELTLGQPDSTSPFCTITCRTGDFFSHFASKSYQNISMNHYRIILKYFARRRWLVLMAMSADGHCHLFCFHRLVFLWCWLKWLACCSVVCIETILHFAAQRAIKWITGKNKCHINGLLV